MLGLRTFLFAGGQLLVAVGYGLRGSLHAWRDSIPWWPFTAIVANGVCLAALYQLYRLENLRLRDVYALDRGNLRRDALTALGVIAAAAVLVAAPSYLLVNLLLGDPARALAVMYQPLPAWIIWVCVVLFPISVALVELPLYYGYVMPRLESLSGRAWLAVLLAAFGFAFQHAALPLVLDWRFVVWRFVPLLPFTLGLAAVLRWRPRLMPYLVAGHFLLDLGTMLMFFWV